MAAGSLALFSACEKEDTGKDKLNIPAPKVEKLSRTTVQSGVEITIYGSGLVQHNITTEVFISGHPVTVVKQSADSITAIVPERTASGQLVVTLSRGQLFTNAYGPDVTIQPTPFIKAFSPVFAFGGQTIELYTENFSEADNNNQFLLNGQAMQVIERKGKDTFVVKVPETSATDVITYNTYGGPVHATARPFQVRRKDYGVATVAEWLHADPAFSYMDALVTGYPELAGGNYEDVYKRIYDSVLQYIRSTDKQYTIFLSSDPSYTRAGITKEDYLEGVRAKPYNYNTLLIAGVVPGKNVHISDVTESDAFNTAYSMLMHWYPLGTDDRNYVTFIRSGEDKYVQIYGMYNESRMPVKMLNEIKVGNATIIETDGELGYVTF